MSVMRFNQNLYENESGAVAVITAIFLFFVMFGIAALAIDIGRSATTKNELQNAADAAALAKASYLYPPDNDGKPNWEVAEKAPVPDNMAGGLVLKDYEAEAGYWNLTGTPSTLQSPTGFSPTSNDVPAVQVIVERGKNKNSGPIKNFFGGLIGKGESSISARAIATSFPPGSAAQGQLFPVAIQEELALKWEQYGENNPVYVASAYHSDDPVLAGQWTSLLTVANDVPTVRTLIYDGNPDPVNIEDDIWIQPGTETALYYDVKSWLQDSPTKDALGNSYRDVFLPVVGGGPIDNKTTHEWREVVGFVGMRITYSEGKNQKRIEGYFIEAQLGGGGDGGTGPYTGVAIAPVLVR